MNREPVQIHKRKSFSAKDRARIFAAHDGVCGLSGVKITAGEAWEIEHRIPLALGGTNDDENLYPALVAPHAVKTKADVRNIAKAKRLSGETGTTRKKKPILRPANPWPPKGARKLESRPFRR